MTRNQVRDAINETCVRVNECALKELYSVKPPYDTVSSHRLYYCNAWVFETNNYFLLKSYDTFVAAIDKTSYITYDVLALVWGKSPTSRKQITRFSLNYGNGQVWSYK